MSLLIEDKPLSAQQAADIITVLGQVSIPASQAANFIALMQSLERLANGTDIVAATA